jgi:ribonuclease H / adenosylcobalamin/alpha-ribazole phosphatase
MGSVFLVRHATTAASVAGTNLGQAVDAPLTADGDRLAERLGRAIALERAALPHGEVRFISSPARRCRDTAEAVRIAIGLDAGATAIRVEDGLRELDYGAWEGLTADECRRRDPELRAAWEADPYAVRAPNGESGADVTGRAFPVLEEVEAWLRAAESRAAVVVSHNHVIRLRLASYLGIPLADYRRRLRIDPGSYSLVTFPDEPMGSKVRRIGALPPEGELEGWHL